MKVAFLGDTAFIGKYYPMDGAMEDIKKRVCHIKDLLSDCDYVVANIETAITKKKVTNEFKTLALRTDPKCVEILSYLGVNIACIANNHIYDYGVKAVEEAVAVLNEAGIQCIGLDNQGFLAEKDGDKAWLGAWCCYTTNAWHYSADGKSGRLNTLSFESLKKHILQAKQMGAYPVILAHWGEENTHYPRYDHIQLARKILTEDEALIVGHHPHVLQGVGGYLHGKAYFSIGNFCFDNCSSKKYGICLKQTAENLKGAVCFLELHSGNASSYIKTFRDNDREIVIDDSILEEVKKYSEALTQIEDLEVYERIRKNEQNAAKTIRLGKRDVKWLLHHLNLTSVMAVVQRRKNQQRYNMLRKNFKSAASDNRKKVILYVGNFDKPMKSAAGKRVYGNKLLLEQCGYKVKLIGKCARKNSDTTVEQDFSYFPDYGMRHIKRYIQWLDEYQEFMNIEPICIIRYGSPALAWFDKLLQDYASEKNIPVIADVVDWLNIDGGNLIFRIIKSFDTWLEKGVLNYGADGLIVISNYLKQVYRNKNILIIPPLVESYETAFTKSNETVKIVYAGNPFRKGIKVENPHKIKDRLDLTVEAIEQVSHTVKLRFDIYGITAEEYIFAFPQHKDLIDLSKSIRFMGKRPMDEVQVAVHEADYTILLREKNRATMAGFPTKVVESLSQGTPVITTRTSDLEVYITEGRQGFFVDINSFDQLCGQLEAILSIDTQERCQIKKYCQEDRHFLPENYKSETAEFLKHYIQK